MTSNDEASRLLLAAPSGRDRTRTGNGWGYLVIFTLGVVALAVFLWYHIASLYRNELAYWQTQLTSVADERAELVADWLKERKFDAELLASRPTIRRAFLSRLSSPGSASRVSVSSDLQKALDETAHIYGYEGVYLLDLISRVIAQSAPAPPLDSELIQTLRALDRGTEVQIEVRGNSPRDTQVIFVVPIFAADIPQGGTASREVLGHGILVAHASNTLFPILTRDASHTQTAENLLVRQVGSEIVYFSPVRSVRSDVPNRRVPLADSPAYVLDALKGREGTMTSIDYRGVRVLAATRAIPATGWGLIRKIDRDEALRVFRRQVITEATAAGFLILLMGGALIAHRRRVLVNETKVGQDRLRAFLDLAPDAIYIFDPASLRILERNKKAAEMDGYDTKDLAHLSVLDLHPPEEGQAWLEASAASGKSTISYQKMALHYRKKNGEIIPVEESQTKVRVGGQDFIVAIFHDVSDRQRAEQKLAESEERYRSVVAALAEGIVVQDAKGTIIACNPSAERILGLTVDQMCGRTSVGPEWKAVHEDGSPFPGNKHPAMVTLRTGESQSGIIMGVHKLGGGLTWISINSQPIWGDDRAAPRAVVTSFSDVTARRQAEEALRRSEAELKDAQRIAHVGNWWLDLANGRIVWSEEIYHIVGMDPSSPAPDLQGQKKLLSPSSWERMNAAAEKMRETGLPDKLDIEIIHPTEGRRWATLRGEAVRDGNGQIVRLRGTIEDITDRRHAEEALRESEERLRQIAESITQVFHLSDVQSRRVLYISPAYEEVWGRSRQSLYDNPEMWPETVHPEDRVRVVETANKLHKQGLPADSEYRVVRPDGSIRWVRDRARVLLDESGRVWRVAGLAEDITDQKLAQEALVKLKKAVDTSGEVIFMTDREGIITFVNAEFTRLYGYDEGEVVGEVTPRILKGGHMKTEEYVKFWNTILSKQVARVQMVNRTKDGRQVNIEATANPILDERGEIAGFLAIQRDVTQHLKLEQQFRQAQKMEAVGQLAGGVAHDFNNLLTVINGYSEVLQERLKPEDHMQKYVSEIKKAGERATGLTRQLLAFSRQQVLAPQVLDLNKVIAGMHSMLHRIIGEDIELNNVPGEGLGLVKADPGQMEQVLLNLAVNSRDAMPHGGRLTIETSNLVLSESAAVEHVAMPAGPYVMLAVSDTGAGMDAETQKRIFEPFFTTKEKGKGTGLGLSTVYGIIKQSGGFIWVYSELGRGTTFKVYLPRLDRFERTMAPASAPAEIACGTETILFVEDDDSIRKLVCETLERRGYKVLKAANGDEALGRLRDFRDAVHLLLTDLVMPGMSGRALAERVTALSPQTKVLYISGYTDDVVMRHGVIGPGTMFLQKPFAPDVLARKVREVLDAAAGRATGK